MDKKALLFPCGLIIATTYLATALDTSFALDRPLHSAAVLLLCSGLAIAAYAYWAQRHQPSRPQSSPERYIAIPLSDGNGRPSSEQPWPLDRPARQQRRLGLRALAVLVVVLLFAIGARVAIFHRVMKDIECAGPSALAFIPLVLALFHSLRQSNNHRRAPAWVDAPERLQLDRITDFVLQGSTRYIIPSLLLAFSSFLAGIKASVLRTTFICPVSDASAVLVPNLQFLGFVFDCAIVLVLYRLIEDGIPQNDEAAGESRDSAAINMLIGSTFTAASLVLAVAGIVIYAVMPEHRQWILSAPSEYLVGLLRLSLMIPLTMLCFLITASLYGIMSAVLITAFSVAYIGVFRALAIGVSFSFPPKSTTGLVLCLILLTISLVLHLVTDTTVEARLRPRIPRLGRNQAVVIVFLLLSFSFGLVLYRVQKPFKGHPIDTLIALAHEHHEQWRSQAHQSKTLVEAVVHYQQRYHRDPPPGFDKWYEYAASKNSIVIDDFDNIEEDLRPFSALSPATLRQRTAELLAEHNGLGGISIRDGKVTISDDVPGTHRWMMDGTAKMVEKFAEFLPDMDLAFNLNDECRVAVPHAMLEALKEDEQAYPEDPSSAKTVPFSPDRDSTWPKISEVSNTEPLFEDAGLKPSFQSFGSVACPSDSPARTKRYWDTSSLCTACAAPHSVGAFVSNWSLSSDPCHQPDIANLHGFYLSPTVMRATHNLVPVFSQSRAPGHSDIRFPSPWNYLDKAKYEWNEKFPDPHFYKKENTLFWRGATSEGTSPGTGAWKGMLRQRLVHLANNGTHNQPLLLPSGKKNGKLEYAILDVSTIKRRLEIQLDARFVHEIVRCADPDCALQAREFGLAPPVDFKQHWHYRYLFDTDGAGFSGRFIPFLQSNSVVFKAAPLFREWYDGRLHAWKHFVPVDLRLHDLFSTLAYFGGYGVAERVERMMEPREKEAEDIARAGKVWTEKVLRKEDMEVYMFRLLLEWGRLTDEDRVNVGFRIEGRGRKGGQGGQHAQRKG
ncbi:hypothetical protein BS50DRAFT_675553 [Corynespora cassiicola Philippines]|uniref:Glycosyl transferase CAP10 domain-containing protein n=1 Tax=Corynespora cassiicola Philippines TaxID=1448308 RepID=A0A2T2NVT7_CORCC|nr:hypothetical protein BS50DRAFT_675553 [Corynespora cassiicola Philippines]